ncbi:MAG: hypothetical protein IIC75_00345 [Bacteroidetes bacterium]|nr:hypothetical protein [Bacteroidota bacterium]
MKLDKNIHNAEKLSNVDKKEIKKLLDLKEWTKVNPKDYKIKIMGGKTTVFQKL